MFRLNTKIRLTMLGLGGFDLYSIWVPLKAYVRDRRCFQNVGVLSSLSTLVRLVRQCSLYVCIFSVLVR